MGNYRFKLSDLIPNSWLCKLKEMSKTRKNQHKILNRKHTSPSSFSSSSVAEPKPHHQSDQRKSYYFTRDLTYQNLPDQESPRKSSRRRRRSTKIRNRPPHKLVSSSVSAGCSCRATLESVWTKPPEDHSNSLLSRTNSSSDDVSILPEFGSDRGLTTPDTFDGMISWSTSCKCSSVDNDMETNGNEKRPVQNGLGIVSEQDRLPPIITGKNGPTKIQRNSAEFSEENAYGPLSVKVVKEYILSKDHRHQPKKTASHPIRRCSPNSPSHGVKLRTNSPRIATRRISVGRKSVSSNSSSGSRRSVGESLAVMKSSKDPWMDFRESMVEMIVENDIRASSDLEELLACYLLLNSSEYHDLIINVFKQIWFDFLHLRLK